MIFFFNDTATTEIYTLSLHDALPISLYLSVRMLMDSRLIFQAGLARRMKVRPSASQISRRLRIFHHGSSLDRKSTRLNSSHGYISYAVFCLKKKKRKKRITPDYKPPR